MSRAVPSYELDSLLIQSYTLNVCDVHEREI
jgi:hypothetical protein